ncbi:Protein N-acetyltransferase, RimJ/RimL family [Paracoccus halophilus]|uniref:Acetyltransferase n=1 Tax=Paracoccus halophilus TaxID=376733 RepID=A0A099F8G3_9RHOB|nr:GNAT family N-acetyltransferase [Paracoccus halophilus]KGJ06493.1 acetyltransferase [Paracoccus halophilus]SFA37980.1 Protein N-acetyltransferase, RimJ/RimL family [Paracoccus halophilus]
MHTQTATLLVDVPLLETGRLVLREPRLSDWDAMNAFGRSERSGFIGGPFEEWQNWGALTGGIGHWLLRGYGLWSVEDRATGRPAGRVGVINHIDWSEPELGWHIYDGFEGRGIAYEAAMAARDHAQGRMGLGPLISHIHPDNTRSRRLAERMGAVVERETELRRTPCLIYRHPKGAA